MLSHHVPKLTLFIASVPFSLFVERGGFSTSLTGMWWVLLKPLKAACNSSDGISETRTGVTGWTYRDVDLTALMNLAFLLHLQAMGGLSKIHLYAVLE